MIRAQFLFRGKYDFGKIDFGVLMFVADKEHFYRRELALNVCNNTTSLNNTIKKFTEKKYIKIFKEATYNSPKLYTITGDGLVLYNSFVKMLERGYSKTNPEIYTVKSYREEMRLIRKSNFNSIK